MEIEDELRTTFFADVKIAGKIFFFNFEIFITSPTSIQPARYFSPRPLRFDQEEEANLETMRIHIKPKFHSISLRSLGRSL